MSAVTRPRLLVAVASLAVAALGATSTASPAQAAPPPNDTISGAMTFPSVPGEVGQSTTRATSSRTDGPHVGGRSIWFTFRAGQTASVPYTSMGSSYDTIVTFFEGKRDDRTLVSWDDDRGPGSTSSGRVRLVKGHTYWVAVSSGGQAGGMAQLRIGQSTKPGADLVLDDPRAGTASGQMLVSGAITCPTVSDVEIQFFVSQALASGGVAIGESWDDVYRCDADPVDIGTRISSASGWAFQPGPVYLEVTLDVKDGIGHAHTVVAGVWDAVPDPAARQLP